MSGADVAALCAALAVCPGMWWVALWIDHRDAQRRRQTKGAA